MKHGVIRRMTGFPASVRRVARTGSGRWRSRCGSGAGVRSEGIDAAPAGGSPCSGSPGAEASGSRAMAEAAAPTGWERSGACGAETR